MPNLNETYHADDFLPAGDQTPFPMPTLAELDRLFMGEQEQTLGLGGFKTWEFGPLNNTLYGGYFGGHQMPRSMEDEVYNEIAFDEGRLVIDESKWLPWFRRDNWWENKIPDDIRKLGGRKYFSVDDDGIWNELRVCLELANRIMNTLIDERHPLYVYYYSSFTRRHANSHNTGWLPLFLMMLTRMRHRKKDEFASTLRTARRCRRRSSETE